jgi:predicted DNA-binding transcriptional regulator AlpA
MSLAANPSEEQYLTALEVATLLRIGVDTVYRHIPCVHIGSVIRFPQSGLDSWIASQKTPSARARARSPFAPKPRRTRIPARGEDNTKESRS